MACTLVPTEISSAPGVTLTRWICTSPRQDFGDESPNDAYSVAFVRRGHFRIKEGSRKHDLTPLRLLVSRPGKGYRFEHPNTHGDDCIELTFEKEFVCDAIGEKRLYVMDTPILEIDNLSFLDHWLISSDTCLPSRQERLIAFATNTLKSLLQRACSEIKDFNALSLDQAAQVDTVLGASLTKPLGIGDIAREVGYSPFHLSRAYRKATGSSIAQTMKGLRLRESLRLFAETKMSVGEVATELCFSSTAHLSSQFSRVFGMSPTQFRNRL
ncbi:MAG TPA: AraC family transcriptional regulator [Fimbriimonadaceae bacterium]|nr:AraC family transcriptional regulator [Fimbriimonadaceae bacterium]